MHVYIRFLEGPVRNTFLKVSSSKFKNNLIFDSNLNLGLKYPVQHKDDQYYKAQIICFDSTEEKLDDKIKKRPRGLLPAKNLDTVSDDSEDQSAAPITTAKSDLIQSAKKKSFEKYTSLGCMNVSNETSTSANVGASSQKIVPSKSFNAGALSKTIAPSTNEVDNNESISQMSGDKDLKSSKKKSVEKSASSLSVDQLNKAFNSKDVRAVSENIAPSKNKIDNKTTKSTESTSQISRDKDMKSSKQKSVEKSASSSVHQPKKLFNSKDAGALSPKITRDDANKQLIAECDKLKKKNATAQKTIEELTSKNTKLEKKMENYRKKADEANEENKKLQERINKLVDNVIEKFQEKQVIEDQLAQAEHSEAVAEDGVNFLPVGHYRASDNTVSIGRGERLSRGVYDNIMASKTPLQCAGNAIMAVFGEKTLLKSTVTGRVSGRTKAQLKNNPTAEGQNENNLEFEALDPTKLSACEDLYSKWVKTKYSAILMAGNKKWLKDPQANEAKQINSFRSYVTKKISYLKRPPEKKPRGKKDDLKNNEEDGVQKENSEDEKQVENENDEHGSEVEVENDKKNKKVVENKGDEDENNTKSMNNGEEDMGDIGNFSPISSDENLLPFEDVTDIPEGNGSDSGQSPIYDPLLVDKEDQSSDI